MELDSTEGTSETSWSIGRRSKRGDAFSRPLLISREAWPYCPSLFPDHQVRHAWRPKMVCWWPWQSGNTRSHPEHGSKTLSRRWYCGSSAGE